MLTPNSYLQHKSFKTWDHTPVTTCQCSWQLTSDLQHGRPSVEDSSQPHYLPMAHGYEASSSFSGIPILDNNGDTKPQRKKVSCLMIRFKSAIGLTLLSQLKKSSGGEQYICNTCCRTDSPEWRKVDLKTSPLFYVASSLVTIDEAKQVLSSHPVGLGKLFSHCFICIWLHVQAYMLIPKP
jgi:hypothetical protein